MTSDDWCQTPGITPPTLEEVAGHREANTFALPLMVLLERGEPMTLTDSTERVSGIPGAVHFAASWLNPAGVHLDRADHPLAEEAHIRAIRQEPAGAE